MKTTTFSRPPSVPATTRSLAAPACCLRQLGSADMLIVIGFGGCPSNRMCPTIAPADSPPDLAAAELAERALLITEKSKTVIASPQKAFDGILKPLLAVWP